MDDHTTTLNPDENVRPTVTGVAVISITPDDPATTVADESQRVVTLTVSFVIKNQE